jgi:hypothetical protein
VSLAFGSRRQMPRDNQQSRGAREKYIAAAKRDGRVRKSSGEDGRAPAPADGRRARAFGRRPAD